jgi:sugar diacid utilization regulator
VTLKRKKPMSQSDFRSCFKLSVPLVEYIWRTLKDFQPELKPHYLLWTLYFLKTTNTNFKEIATSLGIHQKTLRNRILFILKLINNLLPNVRLTFS